MKLIKVVVEANYGYWIGRAPKRFYTHAESIEEGINTVETYLYKRWGPEEYKKRDPNLRGAVIETNVAEGDFGT